MRALVAVALTVGLVLAAAVPHVHPAGHGSGECTVCVGRHGEAARSETPDVAPQVLHAEAMALAPGLAPVTGAPLGAVPGQSPPPGA